MVENIKVYTMSDYTRDYLLDKQIKIFQPINGYRASTDAVLLSASVRDVKNNSKILDVGSGTGAVSLCLAHRFMEKNPQILGLELQEELADLSNMSAKENEFQNFLSYINVDINNKLDNVEFCSFDYVVTNPPYSENDLASPNKSKALAHNGDGFNLDEWIKFCIKMLKPKGYFHIINRAEALGEILTSINGKLGEVKVIPLYSKVGQSAKRVIVIGRKASKGALSILPPVVVHKEGGEYSSLAHKVLRLGDSLI